MRRRVLALLFSLVFVSQLFAQAPMSPVPNGSTQASLNECPIVSAASVNANACYAKPGNFYGYEVFNTTTTVYFLRLFNLAAPPTCSSSSGFIRSIPIPPATAAGQEGGIVVNYVYGVGYSTGIAYCITGGSSPTDNTVAAVGIYGSLKYK